MSGPAKSSRLRVGTRGSPLALAQTAMVCELLTRSHGLRPGDIEVRIITTIGDQIYDRPLAEFGGKGLFTKEIEAALSAGEIDFAVHSAKDMPTKLPDGLVISAYLEREDVRDVLISHDARQLVELPPGARIGTASMRREAQIRRMRPDIQVRSLRGNVHTRLRKVEDRDVDATILGLAGLKRLDLTRVITQVLSIEEFLPAVGQGAVAVETRENDEPTRRLLSIINHEQTATAVAVERAFLRKLEGSCRMPIAGHATVSASWVNFRGMILRPDGAEAYECERTGPASDAERLGIDAGAELKGKISFGLLARAV